MLSMRRFINKGIAVAVMAAMVVTLAPAQNAGAAKKVKLSRTSASITVGKTKKLSVKNGKKKAKVTWKTSKKKIAKIVQKTSKGNKATAKIKGLKKGSAVITASYKLGKKTTKLTCKVTVKNADLVVTPTTVPTVTTAPGTATPLVKPTEPIKKPTETPKNTITNTPRPTSTPTAAPINGSIEAYKVGTEKVITVDGKVTEEAWEDTEAFNVLNNVNSVRGTTSITAATANAMWDDGAFYISAVVTKPEVSATDIVNLFFDEDSKAEGDYKENANAINIKIPVNGTASAVSNGSAYTWEAKAVSNATGYVVEAKVMLKDVTPEVDGKFSFDLQLNDGTASVTYFDAIKDVVYDKENDVWNLTDMGVRVAADTSFMGEVILVPSMAQATTAYYTANGEALRAAADIATDLDESENELLKSKSMKFVDTSYWIDAYNAHGSGSIFFANANIPGYKGNGDMVKLRAEDRDSAQAYIIWDKEYLYVLFDVNDDDIAPASGDHYDTDSVEFFLDEDFDRPTSYMGDEIQVRVDAIDGAFSANEAGTSAYEYVARAVQLKTDADGKNVGYQVQYVIPFMNEHKSGDIMGMDLQINDCFTVESEGTDEDGNPTTVYSPDRAGTLTAYDTTNNAYADPSCFGRVKLYDKDFVDPDADPLPLEPTDGEAVRTESAIVVDGTIDDAWDATDYVEVANYSGTAGDTTAQSKMMWDKDYLYGLVVVNDTSIDKSNTNAWEQDGIEFFLDEDYSKEATYELNTDAFQYRFTGFELEAKENEEDEDVWKAAITNVIATGSADARLSYAEIRVEYEVTATGYVVEYAIPWVSEVATNQVVGFELTVMDCTDGVRNNEISLLGDGGRALYSTPSLMGSLRLVEPKEAPGIDLSGAAALYGTGNVSYNNETGVLTGSGLDGLLIPLGKTIPEGESISITVYGSAPVGARVWLSDSANKRYSDIQTMEFGTTYELTSSNIESGTTCTHFQIKGSAYGVSFDSIEITKVVIE